MGKKYLQSTNVLVFYLPEKDPSLQGCQIFLATTYQNGKNTPNSQKIYQMAIKYGSWA
jgi:Tfp pilus assembly protein PilF